MSRSVGIVCNFLKQKQQQQITERMKSFYRTHEIK